MEGFEGRACRKDRLPTGLEINIPGKSHDSPSNRGPMIGDDTL